MSALLTAGYLLPVSIRGFLGGEESVVRPEKKEPSFLMLAPIVLFTVLVTALGICPDKVIGYITEIAKVLFKEGMAG